MSNPTGISQLSVPSTEPPHISADPLLASNRERIPPPRQAFDFLPDLMAQTEEGYTPRSDIKPLHVIQPEGVSFTVNGHELEWQKWKMHIGTQITSLYINFIDADENTTFSFQPPRGHRHFDYHLQ